MKPIFYYQAASFYYEHDKDLAQAAKWVDQAIEKQQPARYFLYYKKAQIEAKLGHKARSQSRSGKIDRAVESRGESRRIGDPE